MELATITVRVVKSFEYKNYRSVVLRGVDLHATTLGALRSAVSARIAAEPALAQFRSVDLDTAKVYYHKHGAKTSNPMINVPPRDAGPEQAAADLALFLLDDDASLWILGLRDESEITLFNRSAYDSYCACPVLKWE